VIRCRLSRVLILLAIGLFGASPINGIAQAAPSDPPCNGWTLHTRVPHTMCPEVVIDHLPGLPGMAAIGGLAFDSAGALYVSRPALGQVIRLAPHEYLFDPPQVVADGLMLPSGVACNGLICAVATDTTIAQIGKTQLVDDHLIADGLRPLLIGADQSTYTYIYENDGSLIRFTPPPNGGLSEKPAIVTAVPFSIMGLAQTSAGALWVADGQQALHADGQPPIMFDPDSAPDGIAAYPDRSDVAFPDLRGDLIVTTAGSWNALTIAGYELWVVPIDAAGKPGTPRKLIPTETDLSSSNASLTALTFYPDHPIAVAIDPRGWIYIATREGRIVRLRPRV